MLDTSGGPGKDEPPELVAHPIQSTVETTIGFIEPPRFT